MNAVSGHGQDAFLWPGYSTYNVPLWARIVDQAEISTAVSLADESLHDPPPLPEQGLVRQDPNFRDHRHGVIPRHCAW